MRFLVDNALSPVLATLLTQAGHDALHVRTIELHRTDDILIFDRATAEERIVVLRIPTSARCWPPARRRSLR